MIKGEIATVPGTDRNIYIEYYLKYAFWESKRTSM